MKADQMQSRSRHQRGQALHEFHRLHHVVAGAIAPRRLEFQHHLPGAVDTEPLVGDRRAGDIAAQLFEPLPVAAYLDFLNNNALGNYRDVIAGVVRSPAMGRYLSHLRNDGDAPSPNENFARQLLQLFSVGQVKLNANGTPVAGNPSVNTEEVVKGFARTFTGMSYDDRRTNQRCIGDPTETLPAWYWSPDARC